MIIKRLKYLFQFASNRFLIFLPCLLVACVSKTPLPAREPLELPSKVTDLSVGRAKVSDDNGMIQLSKVIKEIGLKRPMDYEGGVYGKVGSATMFIAEKSVIPDFDRLYLVMVKVLSEKYGCFITKKKSTSKMVSVRCRDDRIVVFHRFHGTDWVQFYGRQYDLAGNEVVVANY
ncbi:MAG: hypothetical protein NT027_14460 [Proteobacteria bacterium]|nr:hypothetical protein [Pseudomonadota bacterium]